MSATNKTLLILDLIKGLIATIFGNIGLPPLVRYLIGIIQPALATPLIMEKMGISAICLVITIYAYHKTRNKIIRALVVVFLFVPIILMLLSYFTVLKVPLPF
ncbi:MAG: hypothetical protein V1862_12130 [Methanobacteriota archaeon]